MGTGLNVAIRGYSAQAVWVDRSRLISLATKTLTSWYACNLALTEYSKDLRYIYNVITLKEIP